MTAAGLREKYNTCPQGLTEEELHDLMPPPVYVAFHKWMYGQTIGLCEGRLYNYETKQYEEACGGVAHGAVYYPWDVARFLNGQAVID